MRPRFLFRHQRPGGHVFISTEDPTYRYETLCGHCDFPIEHDDDTCPRCRRKLEDCPVCRQRTHKRSPIVKDPARPTVVYCPVCRVTRHPIGLSTLDALDGSFCTNLYGCPAGGFLLRSDEHALLPRDATICPVCRDPELRPLSIAGFQYLLRHCLFCSTLFGLGASWSRGWSEAPITSVYRNGLHTNHEACALCGRHDRIVGASDRSKGPIHIGTASFPDERGGFEARSEEPQPEGAYLRTVELARSLALETDCDDAAFRRTLHLWFDVSGAEPREGEGVSVRNLVDALVRGTSRTEVRLPLQGRLERFNETWTRHLGVGLGYRVVYGADGDDGHQPVDRKGPEDRG